MSDLVGTPEDRFSRVAAPMVVTVKRLFHKHLFIDTVVNLKSEYYAQGI